MPDRLIRDELLQSERWLWLPSDTDRLVFIALVLRVDDFGNMEGGIRRVFRFMHSFAQVREEENAATVINHLADADLIRQYVVDKREYLHLPRLGTHRQYLVRKCPPSPWCDPNITLGKDARKIVNQGHAKNVIATSSERSKHVLQGVGVVVGVEGEVDTNRTSAPKPVDKSSSKPNNGGTQTWTEHWTAKGKALGIKANPGESSGDYCRRIIEQCKTRNA